VLDVGHVLAAGTHVAIAARLASDHDLLDRLVIAEPPHVDPRLPVWSPESWRRLLAKAAAKSPAIDVAIANRAARLLRRPLGSILITPTEVTANGHVYRVRLLDKRHDLLTYLRFADLPVRSCYRSTSGFYIDHRDGTQDEIVGVWKDP